MDIVNIFLTNDMGEIMEDFVNDDLHLKFGRMGPDGPESLIEGPVWVFIDWVMDDLAGLELCRRLRADDRMIDAHITMVLDEDDPEDRRRSLRAGADDYVIGPIARNNVLDRVIALQSGQIERHVSRRFELGHLMIDMGALRACWAGEPIALRPNEFRLLRFLAENPNRILTREDIIVGLGKTEPAIDVRTVDVWIGRLRRALRSAGAGNPLRTVRSRGYVFDSL